jgi:SAM-dependent methyltransferase
VLSVWFCSSRWGATGVAASYAVCSGAAGLISGGAIFFSRRRAYRNSANYAEDLLLKRRPSGVETDTEKDRMTRSCLYMPHAANTLRGRAQVAFRRLSYRYWGREISRLAAGGRAGAKLRIVEVGCGPGFLLSAMETWFPGACLTGVDADPQLLKVVASRTVGVRTIQADACALPIESGGADVLFALHVVEHLALPERFFVEAHRVLAPRGLLVIATPNLSGLGAKVMRRKWQAYKDPTHISLNGCSFWREMVENSGFAIRRDGTTGLAGLPLLNRMPFGLIHWIPTFFFGHFPWTWGEAYVCAAIRKEPGDGRGA